VKRVFTTNLLLLLLLNILIKPFWIFGIDRSVQNLLGAGEYGMFYTLFNFSLLLNILLDLGITNFNNREISRYPQLIGKYFSNIVGIKIFLALGYALITILMALSLGYNNRQISLLLLLVFNQFLSSLILYLRSNLNGLHFFKLDSVLSVLDKTLMILICSVLLWSNIFRYDFTIEYFVLAQTISYVATAIIAFIIVIGKTGSISFKFELPFSLSMLRSSFPYAMLVLLMTVYSRVDSVVIERILPNGDVAAGIYAQAFRLIDAANMFPFLFASLLLPIFSRMIKNSTKISSFVGFSLVLLLVPVVSFSIPTFAFRGHIMDILYHEHAVYSSDILGVLMGSFIFIAMGYVFGTLLTAKGELKTLNYISFAAVVLGISVQLFLVKRFGILGAAYGNLITNGFVASLSIWFSIKLFQFNLAKNFAIRFISFAITSIAITALLCYIDDKSSINYIIALLLSFISAFIFKLINYKELISFFSKETSLK